MCFIVTLLPEREKEQMNEIDQAKQNFKNLLMTEHGKTEQCLLWVSDL